MIYLLLALQVILTIVTFVLLPIATPDARISRLEESVKSHSRTIENLNKIDSFHTQRMDAISERLTIVQKKAGL